MRTAIVIPARYGSVRLPAKPLLRTTGKYMIQHVYEQACRNQRTRQIFVATDDVRIAAAVDSFGGRVVMTRDDHVSGTDRVAEVAAQLDVDVVVNLQGDEPEMAPEHLDSVIDLMARDRTADVGTLAAPLRDPHLWQSPTCVKVVCDARGRALYFSRSPIPHVRDGSPDFRADPPRFLQHLGIYAYRRDFLFSLSNEPACPLEQDEKLEQLRVLSLGRSIAVGVVAQASSGIDTMSDYEAFVRRYRMRSFRAAA